MSNLKKTNTPSHSFSMRVNIELLNAPILIKTQRGKGITFTNLHLWIWKLAANDKKHLPNKRDGALLELLVQKDSQLPLHEAT